MAEAREYGLLEVRASELDRAGLCPPSLWQVGVRQKPPPAEETRLGSAVHKWMQLAIQRQNPVIRELAHEFDVDDQELEQLAGKAWRCWKEMAEHFPCAEVEREHIWLDEVDQVRLTGHMDVLQMRQDCPHVLDWKSGFQTPRPWNQLRAYALLALDLCPEADQVCCILVNVRKGYSQVRYYGVAELRSWWQGLVSLLRSEQTYSTGSHCGYCPRLYDCPARTNVLKTGLTAWPETTQEASQFDLKSFWEQLPTEPLARATRLAELLERVRAIQRIAEAVRTEIKREVGGQEGQRMPLVNNRELAIVKQDRRRIDFQRGYEALTDPEVGLSWPHLADCVNISKATLEEKVRSLTPGRAGGVRWKALVHLLEMDEALVSDPVELLQVRDQDHGDTK